MSRRRRFPMVTLLDGPLAGQKVTASTLPPGSPSFEARAPAPEPGLVQRHEYRRSGADGATWVRALGLAPMPGLHGTPEFRRSP